MIVRSIGEFMWFVCDLNWPLIDGGIERGAEWPTTTVNLNKLDALLVASSESMASHVVALSAIQNLCANRFVIETKSNI